MKVLICLSLATFALLAQQPPREVPPVGGKPKPFRVPTRQTTTLNNGLRISVIPWSTIPKVTIRADVLTGSVHEEPNQIGLAQLTVALMKEGAAGKSGAELAAEAARMGGDLRLKITPDHTSFEVSVLSEFSADAVKLVAEVLRRPAFPEKELARLKAGKVRELSVSLTSPQQIATDLFRRTLYPDHPDGSPYPDEKMVNSFTIEDVRSFYRRNIGAKRTHIYLSGRFAPSLAKAASLAFADWEPGPEPRYPVPGPAVKKQIITSDRSAAAQTNVRLGLRVPGPTHKDYTPLEVTNALLGGSFA